MKYISLVFLLVILSSGFPQVNNPGGDNWEQFKTEKKFYYAALERSAIKNFSCMVSSDEYIRFIRSVADSNYYYPLKLIWMTEGKAYYILQPFPPILSDSIQHQIITRVKELKSLLKGTLADWQHFALSTPFSDIPADARISFGKDTVSASYSVAEGTKPTRVKKVFTRGGELALVLWASGDLLIATYPFYKDMENKWVCKGWKSQFYKNDEVTSGLAVSLELAKTENVWLPTRFDIIAQAKETASRRSIIQLFLKDYIFNQQFEIVNTPSDTAKASQK